MLPSFRVKAELKMFALLPGAESWVNSPTGLIRQTRIYFKELSKYRRRIADFWSNWSKRK